MRVPIFKEERFSSIPLAGGSAVPYDPKNAPNVNIVKRINGQHLTGEMIPQRETSAKAFNSSFSKLPSVVSTTSMTHEEMIPLLEDDEAEEHDATTTYGAVDKVPELMKELAFDLIV